MNGEELRCSICGKGLGLTLTNGAMPRAVICRDCFGMTEAEEQCVKAAARFSREAEE